MVKTELGIKRTCPDTGKKFYDLNRDPIISPYTQKSWPLSHFEKTLPVAESSENVENQEENKEDLNIDLAPLGDKDVEAVDDDDSTFLESTDDDENADIGIMGIDADGDED